jgi:type II secretory pathway component GspD/PulD (secretin)
MKLHCEGRGRLKMRFANGILGMALALMFSGHSACAQTVDTAMKSGSDVTPANPGALSFRTFYLTNVSQVSDANDLTNALRNLLDPHDKVYLVPSPFAIVVQGTPDQLVLAQKLLSDLDRPKKTYRLTYTLTETDDGKRVGTQHFAMVVVTGQRTVLKQGSKVPIVTGSYTAGSSGEKTEVTYLDVGMNFDATLDEFVNGVRLRTKVEELSLAEEKSGMGPQDPVIRQSLLESTSFLTPGKPLVLGSVDIPGSTRHLDVEVVMELVR